MSKDHKIWCRAHDWRLFQARSLLWIHSWFPVFVKFLVMGFNLLHTPVRSHWVGHYSTVQYLWDLVGWLLLCDGNDCRFESVPRWSCWRTSGGFQSVSKRCQHSMTSSTWRKGCTTQLSWLTLAKNTRPTIRAGCTKPTLFASTWCLSSFFCDHICHHSAFGSFFFPWIVNKKNTIQASSGWTYCFALSKVDPITFTEKRPRWVESIPRDARIRCSYRWCHVSKSEILREDSSPRQMKTPSLFHLLL